MTSMLAAAATSGARGSGDSATPRETQAGQPEYYLWRQYQLRNGAAPARLAAYLQTAALPALNRAGHSPVGVFDVVAGAPGPSVFTLTPLPTLESLATLEDRLLADQEYVSAAGPYLDATPADPAYIRQETSLLAAFPKFPRVVVPAASAAKAPRLFELRTYESPSEKAHLAKVRMFSDMGEIDIFKRVGLTPVFFSRTIAGPRMPSLVYMLVYDNMAARDKPWSTFVNDPEWKRLIATPGYSDPDLVTNITSLYLRPAAYSQI